MKTLPLMFFISFGAAAHVPQMNFNPPSKTATVCNTSNKEPYNDDPTDHHFGRTNFLVLYHAIGCAGTHVDQVEICNHQVLQAGECASYHFRWGTTRRGAQVCLPNAHGTNTDWTCGSNGGGHLSFYLNNGKEADVSHLRYETYTDPLSEKDYLSVYGNVHVHNP